MEREPGGGTEQHTPILSAEEYRGIIPKDSVILLANFEKNRSLDG